MAGIMETALLQPWGNDPFFNENELVKLKSSSLDDPCELIIACEEAGVSVADVLAGVVEIEI